MDKFETYIRENLSNRTTPKPDMKMWSDISQNLEHKQPKNRFFPIWWIAGLGSILGFLYFIDKNDNLLPTSKTQANHNTDTIFIEKIISIHDTIHTNTVVYKYLKSPVYFNASNSLKDLNRLSGNNIISDGAQIKPSEYSDKAVDESNDFEPQIDSETFSSFTKHRDIVEIDMLQNLENNPFNNTNLLLFPNVRHVNRLIIPNKNNSLKPKALYLGLGSGASFAMSNSENFQLGYAFNANVEVPFSRFLSLYLNGSQTNDLLFAQKMDDNKGVPIINSPNENFNFVNAESAIKGFELDFGIKYIYNTGARLQPFFNLGYSIRSERDYELTYNFKHNITDEELGYETVILHDNDFKNFYHLNFGLVYHINPYCRIDGQLMYHNQLNNSDLLVTKTLRPELGFKYRLR